MIPATATSHPPATLAATPLSYRSLSAPSLMHLSNPHQDMYMSAQASQDFLYRNQQQQHFQIQPMQQQQVNPRLHGFPTQSFNQQTFSQQNFAAASHPLQMNGTVQTTQPTMMRSNTNYTYHMPIHPFQVDNNSSNNNSNNKDNVEYAISASTAHVSSTMAPSALGFEIQNDPFPRQNNPMFTTTTAAAQDMDDIQISSVSFPPSSASIKNSSDEVTGATHNTGASIVTSSSPTSTITTTIQETPVPLRSTGRMHSMPFMHDPDFPPFELPEEFAGYTFTRHGSLDSIYPLTQMHNEFYNHHNSHQQQHAQSRFEVTAAMVPSLSSTSITSNCSLPPNPMVAQGFNNIENISNSNSLGSNNDSLGHATGDVKEGKSAKPRRASLSPESSGRVFTCFFGDCRKIFKRSEHLKRHVRSVHTQDK
ncbi:hypothetical protein BX616_003588, partial [Lobosporangium transversale]